MALVKGDLAKELKTFITESNRSVQDDPEVAIDRFCNKIEELVYSAIMSSKITIPIGSIQVQGSPSAQSNLNQIVLIDVIS